MSIVKYTVPSPHQKAHDITMMYLKNDINLLEKPCEDYVKLYNEVYKKVFDGLTKPPVDTKTP